MASTCVEDGGKLQPQLSVPQPSGYLHRFHDWYYAAYCGHAQVQQLLYIQNMCGENSRFWQTYFFWWSELGDAPFYTLIIPVLMWLGLEKEGWALTFFMALNLLATGFFKDLLYLPRPPSPPLRSKGGKHSHGFEYGFPSTHAALTCSLCWEIYQVLNTLYPKERPIIIAVMSFCYLNIVYSRLYLGLHWIGDLAGGVLVFGVIAAMEAAGLRDLVMSWTDVTSVPYWFPFFLAHVICLLLPTPRDPCPCYEDGARFANVCAPAIVGFWQCKAYGIRGPDYDPNELWWFLCSWAFVKRYLFGITIVLVFKTAAGKFSPRLLRPIHEFLCGTRLESIPKPMQGVYTAACILWGVMLGKRIQRNGDFTSDSLDPHFTASAHLVDSGVDSVGNADTASVFARHRNQLWSLRNHKYWFEWDIHSKYITYYVTGYFITFVVPAVNSYVFGSQPSHV
jgi:hypothetical protein